MENSAQLLFKQIQWVFHQFSFINIMEELIKYPIMDTFYTMGVYFMILAFLFGVMWEMYKVFVGENGNLLKLLAIILVLGIVFSGYLGFIVDSINYVDGVARGIVNAELIEQATGVQEEEENKNFFQTIADKLKFTKGITSISLEILLVQFTTILVVLAISVVFFVRSAYLALYIITGPLFLPLVLFEPLRPYGMGWLSSLIQTILWPLPLSVILLIMGIFSDIIMSSWTGGIEDLLLYNCVFLIMILGVMRFFSKIKSATGGFSTIEGLLTVGTMAAGKTVAVGGMKGLAGLKNKVQPGADEITDSQYQDYMNTSVNSSGVSTDD